MYVFLGTWRTSRGGLGAGMDVFDKETLIDKIKGNKENRFWFNQFRYAKINETQTELVKLMTLKEFEEIFDPSIFTPEEITKFFRREVSEKYGKHKIAKEATRIPKKDLEVGRVYKGADGKEYVYLGKIKGTHYAPERKYYYGKKDAEQTDFEGYYFRSPYREVVDVKELFSGTYTPKTVKSVMKFTEITEKTVQIPKVLNMEGEGYKLHVEFLDVTE